MANQIITPSATVDKTITIWLNFTFSFSSSAAENTAFHK